MSRKTFIFICYRREDSSGHMGRLLDRLVDRFGEEQVFSDIDQIAPGQDFVEVIEETVGSCWVVLVIIGRQWLNIKDSEGQRRLDNPEDYVRLEIEVALGRNALVIPVLVQDAVMPRSTDLPPGIARLARRQMVELSDKRWKYDVGRLIKVLESQFEEFQKATEAKAAKEEEKRAEEELHAITSPIVGTFYRADSPTVEPFVKVGSRVEPDTVVCIIEAMKLMNEIQAETTGTVAEIYVENGQAVEYAQPLFGIKR